MAIDASAQLAKTGFLRQAEATRRWAGVDTVPSPVGHHHDGGVITDHFGSLRRIRYKQVAQAAPV